VVVSDLEVAPPATPHLFVDPTHEIVVAKVSSQPLPIDVPRLAATIRGVLQIRKFLSRGSG
jgi:hypothetical protein